MKKLKDRGWSLIERGWLTHEKFGGIASECRGKWWAYPLETTDRKGPFPTAEKAAEYLESNL